MGALKLCQPQSQAETGTDEKIDRLIRTFLSGRSPRTIEAYAQDLEGFRQYLQVPTLYEAVKKLVQSDSGDANYIALNFKTHLMEQQLQATTINRRLAALRSLTKLARTLGLITWKLEVENLKTESYRDTRGPGKTVFEKMLNEVSGETSKSIRDNAILHLLYDLALRASELTNLDLNDCDLKRGTLAVIGKGRTQKSILTLPRITKDVLMKWIKVRGDKSGPLFPNFDRHKAGRLTRFGLYDIVRDLGKRVGIKTRPHGIRHLSITEAVRVAQANGYGLEDVLDHSRHKSVATMMIYRDRDKNVQGQIANLVAGIK